VVEDLPLPGTQQVAQDPGLHGGRGDVVLVADADGHHELLGSFVLPFDQPFEHVVDRDVRRRNQEHPLVLSGELNDELADRCGLARARRALEH
jgi:hypothetical protein